MANPTLSFTTDKIYLNTGYTSNLKIKLDITRTSNTKVKITAKVYTQYEMQISAIYFHFACGSTYKKFTGNYHSITNGYEEITNSKGIQTTIYTYSGGEWFTICKNKEFTVPAGELYFATWFHAPSYYHVTVGAQKYKVYGGQTCKSKSLDSYYTAPSKLNLTTPSITASSIKVKAAWTAGVGTDDEKAVITVTPNTTTDSKTKTITTRGGTTTFSGLKGNWKHKVYGELYDGKTKTSSTDTIKNVLTLVQTPNDASITPYTDSIKITGKSNNSTARNLSYEYRYKLSSDTDYGSWSSPVSYSTAHTISGLTPNTKYNIQIRAYTRDDDNNGKVVRSSESYTLSTWTKPQAALKLELVSGSEHNSIKATASAVGSSSYAKYIFRIDSESFNNADYDKTIQNPKIYTGLAGYSTHTVGVKMKNTESGLESDEVTATITTWHDPLYALSVDLVNNWYWYLAVKSSYIYKGDIKKFEFAIFKDSSESAYVNTGTTNFYSKGSTEGGKSGNLAYNTDYTCKVRITDTYGRVYTESARYKTLDERPIYVIDRETNTASLHEVRLIKAKPDGGLVYVTPDVLNALQYPNTLVNMNKIINNDNRTEFK